VSWKRYVVVLAAVGSTTWDARAYTIASVATEGCHERITSEALRSVRDSLGEAAPLPANDDEQALISDLQFSPDDDMLDLGAVSLLLGVRDNDLKGDGADDLSSLSMVHGDPNAQDEHCLRALDQDEPDGSRQAVAACRKFIEQRIGQALEGLDGDGKVDASKRVALPVHLAIRGGIDASLPLFYVRMGQALHTLQDSFSHTYRTSDGRTVTVALNWLDDVGQTLEESQDGPAHSKDLDACDDADALRELRRELATEASIAILTRALEPGLGREEKMVGVRAVLDQYLGFESGCSFENGWCDAPEARYDTPACGCKTVGSPSPRALAFGLLLAALVWARRTYRSKLTRRRAALGCGAGIFAAALWLPSPARLEAQEAPPEKPPVTKTEVIPSSTPDTPPITATQTTTEDTTTTVVTAPKVPDEKAPPPPNIVPVEEPGPTEPNAIVWGAAATFSGSVDKPGFATALGARLRLHKHWAVGLDGEWNPWISLTGGEPVRSGAFNIYASGFVRFPLAYEQFNLRSQLSLGTSILLTDLYGAPQGTAGLFVGANFLGLEIKASKIFYLVLNPLGVAIPIPQLQGVPFLYPQYRLALGLEFYGG